ncbi:hypothetical protein WG904_17725 [Pedobacter sp. Du54]
MDDKGLFAPQVIPKNFLDDFSLIFIHDNNGFVVFITGIGIGIRSLIDEPTTFPCMTDARFDPFSDTEKLFIGNQILEGPLHKHRWIGGVQIQRFIGRQHLQSVLLF